MNKENNFIVTIFNSGTKKQKVYYFRGESVNVSSAVNLMASKDFKEFREDELKFSDCFKEQEALGAYHARLRFRHFYIDYLAVLDGDVKIIEC